MTFITCRLWKFRFGNCCEAGFARARQTETEPAGSRVKSQESYFALISTDARVVSQSICRVQPLPDLA